MAKSARNYDSNDDSSCLMVVATEISY